eukprot:TRINITY_DN37749_c0_g1_i1.p2 TRINITY_DN37749_c0_g1~~TRINITY_DN37749_c0_g1_i1.p2  ORF type:complete len:518 (+),score=126.51 TRINITY_DN37749_c0_g1_i1:82-1554(+)
MAGDRRTSRHARTRSDDAGCYSPFDWSKGLRSSAPPPRPAPARMLRSRSEAAPAPAPSSPRRGTVCTPPPSRPSGQLRSRSIDPEQRKGPAPAPAAAAAPAAGRGAGEDSDRAAPAGQPLPAAAGPPASRPTPRHPRSRSADDAEQAHGAAPAAGARSPPLSSARGSVCGAFGGIPRPKTPAERASPPLPDGARAFSPVPGSSAGQPRPAAGASSPSDPPLQRYALRSSTPGRGFVASPQRAPSPGLKDDAGSEREREKGGWERGEWVLMRFWRGERVGDCVCGCARISVDEMLSKRGNYQWLEQKHHFMQWLFPKAQNGVSGACAPTLTPRAAAVMVADAAVRARVTAAYRMILDFWGLDLEDEETGALAKAPHCGERMQNVAAREHNYLRITRVLISIGMLGRAAWQGPLVELLISEVAPGGLLAGQEVARGALLRYWVPAVRGRTADGTPWQRHLKARCREAGIPDLAPDEVPESPYFRSCTKAAMR